MKKALFALVAVLLLSTTAALSQKKYEPNWESIDSRPTPAWFDEAKFGIFIHWGVYSVPSWGEKTAYSEWYWYHLLRGGPLDGNVGLQKYIKESEKKPTQTQLFHYKTFGRDFKYQDFAPMFKAELFNPDEWADLFKKSGAKYIVLTSKHHEGFTLWPSEYSWNWNSVDIGPHRDLLGDLTKSVRSRGIKMGFYYSLYEWFNPQYLNRVNDYVDQHMIPQMKELVSRYKPAVLWTDGEWDHPSDVWKSTEFLSWLYNESPSRDEIVINDRWGKETRSKHGGVYTSEYGNSGRKVPFDHKWEENQGMGKSFGFNRNEDATNYRSSTELMLMLIDTVSNGGNLLLDIGPTADGRVPVIMQQRLIEMGEWLAINGDAIYSTKPWRVHKEADSIFYTGKDGAVYVICTAWPGKELVLKSPKPDKSATVKMLGQNGDLKWKLKDGAMVIEMPQLNPDKVTAVRAYAFKLTGVK